MPQGLSRPGGMVTFLKKWGGGGRRPLQGKGFDMNQTRDVRAEDPLGVWIQGQQGMVLEEGQSC